MFENLKRMFTRSKGKETQCALADALLYASARKGDAMRLSSVNRAVQIISDGIASLPVRVRDTGGGQGELMDHPVNFYFNGHHSRSTIDKYHLMKRLVTDMLLKGNGYAYIQRDTQGKFYALRYLQDVTVLYDSAHDTLTYSHQALGIIDPADIVHLRHHTSDGITGRGEAQFAVNSIGLSTATERSAEQFFASGCNLSGILKVQGNLTEAQKQQIRSSWKQAYNSGDGSGLAVLPGNMDYQSIQKSGAEAQMLETRGYNVQDIARFFGISPVLLGDLSHGNFSAIESVQNQFVLHTLRPFVKAIESEFSRKLLTPQEIYLTVDLDETDLLKSDKAAIASYYGSLLQNGVLSINEVRHEMGLQEVEGLDKHLIAYTNIQDNTINGVGGPESDETAQ
ncbi:MAG: phage portal protein [Bacteroidales bacterium]|nr:phage portal protein [Candidatus Colicola equi]